MNNLNYESYVTDFLNRKLVNNTKIMYRSLRGYHKVLVKNKNKKMITFMKDYINIRLNKYYEKGVFSNDSIIFLLKDLICFMEVSEIFLDYNISVSERKKLNKFIKTNDSSNIVNNRYVKKNKGLEIILLLEMGLYNLLKYYKIYRKNINTMTDLFVGNESEFYKGFVMEIEPQLRSIINSIDSIKNIDTQLNIKVSNEIINDIDYSLKMVKKQLKELI